MPRLTRRAFVDLAIWMMGFGVFAGVVFPFFVVALGVSTEQALTPRFFTATFAAGLMVGAVNFGLARLVFHPRLKLLSSRMLMVEESLRDAIFTEGMRKCDPDTCRITEDSEDEIGQSAQAFNQLVGTLARAHDVEEAVNGFSRTLSENLDYGALTDKALKLLLRDVGARAGALLVEREGELTVPASIGLIDAGALGSNDRIKRVLRENERLVLDMPEDLILDGVVSRFTPRQVVIAPIEYNGVVFGAVVLAAAEEISNTSQRLLSMFLRGLGLALNNSLAHERLQYIAAIDPLTNLYNRRFGLQRLHEEFTRAQRTEGGELSVIIFGAVFILRCSLTSSASTTPMGTWSATGLWSPSAARRARCSAKATC